jgi:PAS domain S-box-containing protein
VEVCLEYLRRGGTDWPAHPTTDEVRREYEQIWSRLGSRQIEELLDLPRMTNPDVLDTLEVLTEIVTPAVFFDQNLCSLAICRMVNLSLEHGNSDGSCFAYVWFGIITGPRFGNHRDGFRFGRLGYDLVERRSLRRYQARTYMSFGNLVLPWVKHALEGRDLVRRAFDTAHRAGDFTFAAYSLEQLITNLLVVGDPLPEVQSEAERGLAFARTGRFGLVVDLITSQLQLVRTLRGLTRKFGHFDDEQFDETRFEQHLASNPVLADAEFGYWALKAQARFLAGDYASAVHASLQAQPLLWSAPSLLEPAGYRFFSALSHAAFWDCAPPDQKPRHLEALRAHCRQIEMLAEHCPANFADRAALVGAELARIEGRTLDALHLYEQAIHSARDSGFVHGEGIANEVAGRFYLSRGLETNAYAHLRNALACFGSWGAEGKLTQLTLLYPRLASPDARQATATPGASLQQPDVAAVIKASQALSSEIALPRLVERLMTITLQNAGADRGLLVLPRAEEYRVAAEAIMDGAKLVLRHGSAVDPALPGTIVRYVVRSRDKVIIEDAVKPNSFSEDEYLGARKPRSLLCLPLVRQGVLGGVLYLENTLTSHAFTPARTALLEMLASQAAISLENTRLYGDLQEREAKVRRLVDANIIGIFIWNLQGRIVDANEAFLRIIGYSREDLVSGRMNWSELTPPEWRVTDEQHVAEVRETGTVRPYEKEYRHMNGNRVPVLIGGASFEGERDEGVAFVLDLTDRKRAEQAAFESERRYREVEVALAHANRLATLGQLSASIAHEIKQPVAAAVTNAQAALRWLGAQPPDIGEAMQAISHIIKNGNRAGEVISRIRALVLKAPHREEWLEVNEAIREVIALIHGEVVKNCVSVQTQFAQALPPVQGDRVQLQQVVLNLVINSVEAMSGVALGSRELLISTAVAGSDVLVTVRDSGPGFAHVSIDRVFEAFYTTKPGGLGLGLSICNSIIQAHGGRLWASAAGAGGATLQFTLPGHPDSARVSETCASGSRA